MFPLPPRPVEMTWLKKNSQDGVEGTAARGKAPYHFGIARRDGLPAASVGIVFGTVDRRFTGGRTEVARAATASTGGLLFRRADKDMMRSLEDEYQEQGRKKSHALPVAQGHDPARKIVRYVGWTYESAVIRDGVEV